MSEQRDPLSSCSIDLIGDALLVGGARRLRLERKTAGLIAYLAIAGPTSRQRLAGLLWPEVDERRARNSLAQLLRRLRAATFAGIVTGAAVLELGEGVATDVARLKLAAIRGEPSGFVSAVGELLQNFEFDDCPEFAEWLDTEREAVRQQFARALLQRTAELEAGDRLDEAVALARRLIALDPVAESPYRLAMRLLARAGDRAAALAVFADCRTVLQRELGVEPSEELQAFAADVQRGAVPSGAGRVVGPTGPAGGWEGSGVAEPVDPGAAHSGRGGKVRDAESPRFVGRDAELSALEAAWRSRLPVYVSGPAGVGKSRLAYEFLSSKGPVAVMEGRPGDESVPLLTLSRACRRLLVAFPHVVLEGWVRTELSRLVPELGDAPPPPLRSADDQLRFQAAVERLHGLAGDHGAAWLFDDLQFADRASADAWSAAAQRSGEEGPAVPTVVCFRDDEVEPELVDRVEELSSRGLAVHLRLGPLDTEAVAAIVGDLGGTAGGSLAEDVFRYTGGHPLAVVETLRHLGASGRPLDRLPERMPPPGKVAALVRRRVERLSDDANRLVKAAAVLQSDLDLEQLAAVLDEEPLGLVDAWRELEVAGVVSGSRFAHDLVHEAILAAVSQPVRTLLHRRTAAVLAATGAASARVAGHWLAGGRQREAMHALFRAGEEAEAGFRLLEARDFYRRASSIAELIDDDDLVFEALARELELVLRDDTGKRSAALLGKLEAAARTEVQRARADVLAATRLNTTGRPRAAEERARAGLVALAAARKQRSRPWGGSGHEDGAGDVDHLHRRLLEALATALWEQNRHDEALAALSEVAAALADGGDEREVALNRLSTGAVLNRAGRDAEALEHQVVARAAFERLDDRCMTAIVDMHVGVSHESLGDYASAEGAYLRAGSVLGGVPGMARYTYNNSLNLAYLYCGLERYDEALAQLQEAEASWPAMEHSRAIVARVGALVYRALGRWSEFDLEIAEALRRPDRTDPWRSHARIVWAEETGLRGDVAGARGLLAAVERDLGDDAPPILRAFMYLARARVLGPAGGLADVERAHALVREWSLPLTAEVELRRAQVLLAAGRAAEALERGDAAIAADARQRLLGQRAELWFTRFKALSVLGRPGAADALARAHRYVLDVAAKHVPSDMRERFLGDNRLNAEVLRAVEAGLAQAGVPL